MAMVAAGSYLIALAFLTQEPPEPPPGPPHVLDDRLVIENVAAEPDIVTPVSVAIDAKGRGLVIESHTHFRPEGYPGPPADRIRAFEDTDGDGKADKITTAFEGTKFTMGLAPDPRDGS